MLKKSSKKHLAITSGTANFCLRNQSDSHNFQKKIAPTNSDAKPRFRPTRTARCTVYVQYLYAS